MRVFKKFIVCAMLACGSFALVTNAEAGPAPVAKSCPYAHSAGFDMIWAKCKTGGKIILPSNSTAPAGYLSGAETALAKMDAGIAAGDQAATVQGFEDFLAELGGTGLSVPDMLSIVENNGDMLQAWGDATGVDLSEADLAALTTALAGQEELTWDGSAVVLTGSGSTSVSGAGCPAGSSPVVQGTMAQNQSQLYIGTGGAYALGFTTSGDPSDVALVSSVPLADGKGYTNVDFIVSTTPSASGAVSGCTAQGAASFTDLYVGLSPDSGPGCVLETDTDYYLVIQDQSCPSGETCGFILSNFRGDAVVQSGVISDTTYSPDPSAPIPCAGVTGGTPIPSQQVDTTISRGEHHLYGFTAGSSGFAEWTTNSYTTASLKTFWISTTQDPDPTSAISGCTQTASEAGRLGYGTGSMTSACHLVEGQNYYLHVRSIAGPPLAPSWTETCPVGATCGYKWNGAALSG